MRIVQCSCLGKFGGFGNQLFQFCFAQAYAEKYDAVLEIPADWIGRDIFKEMYWNHITRPIPQTKVDQVKFGDTNIDLYGYFQYKECLDLLSLSNIKKQLIFEDKWVDLLSPKDSNYTAFHFRHSDYIKFNDTYCLVTAASYYQAALQYKIEPQTIREISDADSVRDDNDIMSFLPDFFKLMYAKNLFRANSTFSFWAGVLGQNDKIYSPVVERKVGWQDVEFVEGNHPKFVGDYKVASPQKPCDLYIKE